MNLRKILLSGCFAVALTTLSAQEQKQETLSLTLEQAKEYALSYNRSLKMADLSVQKAEKAKWQAIATMLPHADANLNYTNFLGYEAQLEMGGAAVPIPMNPTGDLTAQATMAFSGMQIVGVQLSKMAVKMSEINKDISELDVKANITTAYLSALIAEESKRLLENNKENLAKLYNSTSKLYEVGMAEQTAVDQLDVQVGILSNAILTSERNIELAYNSLRLILGSYDVKVELTETLDDVLAQNNAYTIALEEFDLNENYNVQLLTQNIELSKKQLNLKKWEYAPTLAFFYQYTTKTYFGKAEGFNMTPPNTVGASLSIPIFSSGERLSKVQQAKFDLKTAELTKEDAIQGLLVQEQQMRFNLRSAIEAFELQKKNVEVSERIFKNTVQKYEIGTVSSTELTTINNNLLTAHGSYISALMELFTAQVNLQKLLNNL